VAPLEPSEHSAGEARPLAPSATGLVTSPDETDAAPNNSAAPLFDMLGSDDLSTARYVTSNTSGQIGIRGSSASNVQWSTSGWDDFRRS
jgi:hypothetical protein